METSSGRQGKGEGGGGEGEREIERYRKTDRRTEREYERGGGAIRRRDVSRVDREKATLTHIFFVLYIEKVLLSLC